MLQSFKQLAEQALLNFFFPESCPHCQQVFLPKDRLLCPVCTEQIEALDHKRYCPYCAELKPCWARTHKPCALWHPNYCLNALSSFSLYQGPLKSLLENYQRHPQAFVAEALAPFLAYSLAQTGWSIDRLCPLPQKEKQRANNLLAEALATLIDKPCHPFSKQSFKKNQSLLLISATLFDLKSVFEAARFLRRLGPVNVYSLSLCKREKIDSAL